MIMKTRRKKTEYILITKGRPLSKKNKDETISFILIGPDFGHSGGPVERAREKIRWWKW